MKILYLITKSNFGGAQKYVFELAVATKVAGHDVAVAAGGTGAAGATTGHLIERLNVADIKAFSIKHFMRDMSPLNDILAFFEIWQLLRRHQPDVLHVTSSKAGGIGALAGRLCGIKRIVFTSHGLTIDEVWRPEWQKILIYIGTWATLRLTHHSIMISTETYERTKKMPFIQDRVSLIKNGIANIDFIDRAEARTKLAPDVSPQAIWIGGIGELHPNKNWSVAIVAMISLPQSAHLFIIGEGEEDVQLNQLVNKHQLQDRVHLLGYVDGAKYLKAFDIFVLPSKKEGLPYVLLEAGLAGLAVIASDLPGNRDIIPSGETGLLVEPTSKLVATTMEMLIRDEGMRRQLGVNLKRNIEHNFSVRQMFDKTFTVYSSSNTSDT